MTETRMETIPCKEAGEFLEQIRHYTNHDPFGRIVSGTTHAASWIFRGQGNGSALLIPTALRPKAFSNYLAQVSHPHDNQLEMDGMHSLIQIRHEAKLLQAFCRAVDHAGMQLPEDSQDFRQSLSDCMDSLFPIRGGLPHVGARWPFTEYLTALALMQHYGLPTRLLDWTRGVKVAAYFAATSGLRQIKKHTLCDTNHDGLIAVFALDESRIDEDRQHHGFEDSRRPVQIVSAPYFSNPNLRAQQGLFTVTLEDHFGEMARPVPREPLNEILSGYVGKRPSEGNQTGQKAFMYRFTLPWDKAIGLLQLLSEAGVTAAEIYPGYKSIGTAFQERSYWFSK